jgi:hypothetical protein
MANNEYMFLNATNAKASVQNYWNSTTPTSTVFTLGSDANVNANGGTYVAYLFAHDAGGFGLDGTQNVISCGSVTTNSSGVATVNLGYEPQFVLIKTVSTGGWVMLDSMRGNAALNGTTNTEALLSANTAGAESQSYGYANPLATGFQLSGWGATPQTFIYMAIRRGPMKVPTDATTVFSPLIRTGTGATATISSVGFPSDIIFSKARATGVSWGAWDRLRGVTQDLSTDTADPETLDFSGLTGLDSNVGYIVGSDGGYGLINTNSRTYVNYPLRRAPSFMDVVCYNGTGTTTQNVTHNLGVQPELIIYKSRSNSANWIVHTPTRISQNKFLWLNSTPAADDNSVQGYTNSGTPTATLIRPGMTQLNMSGWTYVAYLFATCTGVSKVGTYTGTGGTQTISCGFTGGARYVLIKRTDSSGSWWVWDTARGMVAGTDPRLAYNSINAETNANWVYTTTGGFQIVTSDATINANGGTYLYLSIA